MSDDLIPPMKRRSYRRRDAPRKVTVPRKRLTAALLAAGWKEIGGDPGPISRPRVRSECPTSRPCVHVSCRHHNYLEINATNGSITFNRPDIELHEFENSCSLDVAESGAHTLEQIGEIIGVVRERARQISDQAVKKMLNNTRQIS